ncbi:MAG: hypothetical protein CM15mP32_2610 [Flavobacteriaceae bacterium]|nr:MAG: hypothetical protein CM15mP32_2610 [Flavobacteriaceae bacterium]
MGTTAIKARLKPLLKPFVQAKNAIRALSEQQRQKNINVYLRGGTIRCQKLLFLNLKTQEQTNQNYLSSYQNETPIISSGIPLRDWKKLETYPAHCPK